MRVFQYWDFKENFIKKILFSLLYFTYLYYNIIWKVIIKQNGKCFYAEKESACAY